MTDSEAQERTVIGQRLQKERQRLGINQTILGEKIGSARRTVSKWELGESTPPAAMLSRMVGIGIDVFYVVTGQHIDERSALTKEERELVKHWRSMSEDRRQTVLAMVRIASCRKDLVEA